MTNLEYGQERGSYHLAYLSFCNKIYNRRIFLLVNLFYKMLKATKELIKIVETKASEQNSSPEAHELLQQGADITAPTNNGPMIQSVIAEEKRYRLAVPWRADNCQNLIQVLERDASDRLSAQVFSVNGGDLKNMHTLLQLKASCYQSTKHGSLGLLGSLLRQNEIPIRLDVVRFLIETDPDAKDSLTAVDDQQQTILSLAKNNEKCPSDVIDYLQEQFDDILTQIPFVQPQIDPNEVTMWIHRGANIEAIDKNSNTALSNAVIADNLKLVRVLVSAGSNTAHRNADGLTPLQIAQRAVARNPPLIAILETQHVNVELKCLIETKKSQLTVEEVRTLLENGADINAAINNNNSFLHLLIANKGTPEMVTTFVNEFNADLSATNTSGHRPIELCVQFDEEPLVHLSSLFKLSKMTSDLFTNSKLNQTLLQYALETQRFEAAKVIQNELNLRLWNCAMRSINTKDFSHETGMVELKILVSCGAQINYKSSQEGYAEQTILHIACEVGIERLVEYTVKDLQADYTLQNYNGDYPISIAAENGHLSIVRYLCSLPNSTLNRFNKDRQTPLHLATKKHYLSVVQHLVTWGADHQAQNLLKQTPLDVARTNGFKNKEEEMSNKKIIYILEQLLCPPVDDSLQQSANGTQPSYDLDTCDQATPVVLNPIRTSGDDEEEALGKQWKGLFSGSPNNNLHEAAKNGSVWEAQKAIGQGADIRHRKRHRTAYDVTVLSEKEYSSHLQSAKLIIVDRSMLENMVTGCQQIASMIQRVAQIKLVEGIDQSNPSKVMSYHVAGASLTVDLLYRSCNASDNVEIVDYLLNQNADIYQTMIQDASSNCPYRIARKKNFSKLANYLRYRLSVECANAVRENSLAMVKNLVHAGASVNMHDTNNLNEALKHQNADLIQFLCEQGVEMPSEWITAENIVLDPVFAQQLKPEIVHCINQFLINRRLRFAAASGDLDSVIRCQRLGADINSVNCHGSTALLYAIQYGNNFPIVHTLVSRGASILHSNEDEPTSLIDLAKKKGYKQIADYLSKELNSQFLSAIANNHRQVAEKLAQMGVDFNYQDEEKRTALHYAVEYHGAGLVNWLCECGSTPTVCDINGDYPIIQATQKGNRFDTIEEHIPFSR